MGDDSMMEFDYDYDVELFNYEDGVEVYSIHNYTCDHDISEDEIEDAVDTYYSSMGYPNTDTKALINLIHSLYNEGDEE